MERRITSSKKRMTKKGLSAGKTLVRVFEDLQKKLDGKEIIFPDTPRSVTMEYSSENKIRTGYSLYERVMMATTNGIDLVVALGTPSGDYPDSPFVHDIVVVRILPDEKLNPEEKLTKEIWKKLVAGRCFKNSIIIAMTSGEIILRSKGIFKKIPPNLLTKEALEKFTARELKYRDNDLPWNFQCFIKSPRLYTEAFPKHLSYIISNALAYSVGATS